jgi:hypothetical protein
MFDDPRLGFLADPIFGRGKFQGTVSQLDLAIRRIGGSGRKSEGKQSKRAKQGAKHEWFLQLEQNG